MEPENTNMIPKHNDKHLEGVIWACMSLSWPTMAGAIEQSEASSSRYLLTANCPEAAIGGKSGKNDGEVAFGVDTKQLNKSNR